MEMFSNLLALDYLSFFQSVESLSIIGFAFLIMVIQILAFYIAGRMTGSIDDEIISAFTLLGALLVIVTTSALINTGINIFLEGALIPGVIASIVYLIAIIYSIVKIYELSIGKAILHLIISLIITIALTGLTVFIGGKVIPKSTVETVSDGVFMIEIESELESEKESEMDVIDKITGLEDTLAEAEDTLDEAMDEVDEVMEEESTPSDPGLPGTSE